MLSRFQFMGANLLQNAKRKDGSWFPLPIEGEGTFVVLRPDFGAALFQISVSAIDSRQSARPSDIVAALAFLAGRAAQQLAMTDNPSAFRLDQAGHGGLILLSDQVSSLLGEMTPGSLASILLAQAVRSGAGRLPDFTRVRMEAREAMERHGRAELRGQNLSAFPVELAGEIQSGFDALFAESDDRLVLVRSVFDACGRAVSYVRNHIRPEEAAEFALSIAFYASWLDRRRVTR